MSIPTTLKEFVQDANYENVFHVSVCVISQLGVVLKHLTLYQYLLGAYSCANRIVDYQTR